MEKNQQISFFLTLALATFSCGSGNPSVKRANAAPINAVMAQPKQMIVEATGKVEVIGEGASNPRSGYQYTDLSPGDLLKPSPGSRVRVACDGGSVVRVPAGVTTSVNKICPQLGTTHNKRRIITPRPGNSYIPYIISPRATLLLTDKPILRWNGAIGANSFRVTVRGRELNWTEEFSRDRVCQGNICEVVYPGDPPLQPGVGYKLVISTDTNRSSTEDTTPRLGFNLINEGDAEEVKTIAQRIEKQDLSDQTKALFLARRYADYNLIAEAIETLEKLPKNKKIASVYRLLGDFYRLIGLILEAEVQYLEAVKLAKASENMAEFAAAKAGLGEVRYARGNGEEGIDLLEEAKGIYEELGDKQRVSELEERVEELKR